MSKHIFMQGSVYINGVFAGDVDEYTASFENETIEHKESVSGTRQIVAAVDLGNTANLQLNLREATAENLALALYATKLSKIAGTFSDAAAEFTAGKLISLSAQDVSNVVITDAQSNVLVEGTDYTVNAKFGSVMPLVSKTGAALPITIAGDNGESTLLTMLTATPAPATVRLEGKNLANGEFFVQEFYRVKFAPLSSLSLIGAEFGALPVSGKCLADLSKPIDGEFGQTGRYIVIG